MLPSGAPCRQVNKKYLCLTAAAAAGKGFGKKKVTKTYQLPDIANYERDTILQFIHQAHFLYPGSAHLLLSVIEASLNSLFDYAANVADGASFGEERRAGIIFEGRVQEPVEELAVKFSNVLSALLALS